MSCDWESALRCLCLARCSEARGLAVVARQGLSTLPNPSRDAFTVNSPLGRVAQSSGCWVEHHMRFDEAQPGHLGANGVKAIQYDRHAVQAMLLRFCRSLAALLREVISDSTRVSFWFLLSPNAKRVRATANDEVHVKTSSSSPSGDLCCCWIRFSRSSFQVCV